MENTFKGTKGKWYMLQFGSFYLLQDDDFYEANNLFESEDVGSEKAAANARLATKAPEMLEMLKLISEKAEEIYDEPDGEDNRFFDEIDFEKLDNLIKSATEL